MTDVDTDDLPALHGFVRGLRIDQTAVAAGSLLPHSNGPIGGANTQVKLLIRQMYGRAGFALVPPANPARAGLSLRPPFLSQSQK